MKTALATILYGQAQEVQLLVERLQLLVGEACPEAREKVYPGWKIVAYSLGDKPLLGMFCYIGVVKGGVNLGFNQGASLADPLGLLQGRGKSNRQVRFRTGKPIPWEAVRSLVENAYALALWQSQTE